MTRRLLASVGIGFALLVVSPALAQISCGDVLGPGGKFTATGDIGPCPDDPAITIIGSVKVDFSGHEVICDSTGKVGIAITGKGAKVENGSVVSCGDAITVGGEGKHKLTRMVARANATDGFTITSDGNKFKECAVAVTGAGDGFRFENADGNSMNDCHASRVSFAGFHLIQSNGNKFKDTSASGVDGDGYVIEGDGNKFTNGSAMSIEAGVQVTGDANAFKNFTAASCGAPCFEFVDGEGNKLTKCAAISGNDEGIVIRAGATATAVSKCHVRRTSAGLLVESGATASNIKKNVLFHSNGVDAEDANAGCGTNVWKSNSFGTSVPAPGGCVQ